MSQAAGPSDAGQDDATTDATDDWPALIVDAVALGISQALLWSLTPRELDLEVQGAQRRAEQRQREGLSLAWHMAGFSRQKRLPPHDRVVGRVGRGRSNKQSVQDMIAMAHHITRVVNTGQR